MIPLKKVAVLLVVLFCIALIFFFVHNKKQGEQNQNDLIIQSTSTFPRPTVQKCLSDDEVADYDRLSQNPAITQPKGEATTTTIFVKNKDTGAIVNSFQIQDILKTGHPMEIHRCGVYLLKGFGFDYRKFVTLSDYREELWFYNYNGSGVKILEMVWKDSSGKSIIRYSDFQVSPDEKYLALVRGYGESNDYAIVVKSLENTSTDAVTVPRKEIVNQYPDLAGDFELRGWSSNSKYFWADIFLGANTMAFVRADIQKKTYQVFPVPADVLGGDALNLDKGLITLHPGNVWFGVAQEDDTEKARRRAQGIGTELYIQNLFTGKRLFVASTTEPLYYFKPQWTSGTELQYTLPSGATSTYTIP